MRVRARIWMLPLLAAVIFGIGIGIATVLAFSARTSRSIDSLGKVAYPYLDAATRFGSQPQKELEATLKAMQDGGRAAFDAGLNSSRDGVSASLYATLASALAVVAGLGIDSLLVIGGVWRQFGGEPEYARAVTLRIAGGDLSVSIDVQAGADNSLLAAMRDMASGLATLVGEVRSGSNRCRWPSCQGLSRSRRLTGTHVGAARCQADISIPLQPLSGSWSCPRERPPRCFETGTYCHWTTNVRGPSKSHSEISGPATGIPRGNFVGQQPSGHEPGCASHAAEVAVPRAGNTALAWELPCPGD